MSHSNAKPLPRRPYKDGVELSIVGFGGIVVCGESQAQADRLVSSAIDRGVDYFDVAPSYFDGEAEIKLGDALRGRRDGVFYACKTGRRDAEGARRDLERSLARAHTDRFDLYQFHAVTSRRDVEAILGPGGAGEAFRAAKERGQVRFLGASCHTVEAATALLEAFPLDSLLFPVNYVCAAAGDFGPQVLAEAERRGVARLALKALAYTPWSPDADRSAYQKCWYRPQDEREAAKAALSWTLARPITAFIPPGDGRLFRLAVDLAADCAALGAAAEAALLAGAAALPPLFRYPAGAEWEGQAV